MCQVFARNPESIPKEFKDSVFLNGGVCVRRGLFFKSSPTNAESISRPDKVVAQFCIVCVYM